MHFVQSPSGSFQILKGDALEEFNEYYNKVEEHMKHIEGMVQRMSPEAKQALDKLFDLHAQEYRIIRNLSESAEDELFDLWRKRRASYPRQALWMKESQWL
ncbi:hypothetical protein ANCDUO_07754 [Ancylostoma duodenale]|uniref:Uncharacterized protein n=1 Tax=Ancylostoma duodenale TaxID=51022 RepID=A0A0C2DHN4_9BILA|nr:hypothetical protein ANCDUO_07754 [Ancylostoma duodenale]